MTMFVTPLVSALNGRGSTEALALDNEDGELSFYRFIDTCGMVE